MEIKLQETLSTDTSDHYEVPFSHIAVGLLYLGIFLAALSLLWV